MLNRVRRSEVKIKKVEEILRTKDRKGGEMMEEEKFDFENLKVYQKALEYVDFVTKLQKTFPKRKNFL